MYGSYAVKLPVGPWYQSWKYGASYAVHGEKKTKDWFFDTLPGKVVNWGLNKHKQVKFVVNVKRAKARAHGRRMSVHFRARTRR
jgi:hypothetical protein